MYTIVIYVHVASYEPGSGSQQVLCEPPVLIITPLCNHVDYTYDTYVLVYHAFAQNLLVSNSCRYNSRLCGAFSQAAGASTRANEHKKEAAPTLATIHAKFAARYAQAQCLPHGESSPPRLVTTDTRAVAPSSSSSSATRNNKRVNCRGSRSRAVEANARRC